MTPDEKITKIRELEQSFLSKLEEVKKEYQLKMKELVVDLEKQKIESLHKDLGI